MKSRLALHLLSVAAAALEICNGDAPTTGPVSSQTFVPRSRRNGKRKAGAVVGSVSTPLSGGQVSTKPSLDTGAIGTGSFGGSPGGWGFANEGPQQDLDKENLSQPSSSSRILGVDFYEHEDSQLESSALNINSDPGFSSGDSVGNLFDSKNSDPGYEDAGEFVGLPGGGDDDGSDDGDEYGQGSEKEALYEAYNLLHKLAQDFQKPFDAPAVVVVGHQSSGKSALIEALMGFQFNQVGGGTKTRRPIALRMQYNPSCAHPRCFLEGEDGIERPKTLSEIQEYIQSENRRLERDPVRCFESREINVRVEYKYCPNMILIDTPGLINAPRVPRGRSGAGAASVQHRALLASAREAERLVVSKMRCPDYIILCVEDTSDWKHGPTREVVMKADPDLSRTIIVNTKLDTKVPQFGTTADVADFLRADIIDRLSPHKLGGPFFTSVPSGRVGRVDGGNIDDYLFDNDDAFVAACAENEESDRAVVWQRLKKYGGNNDAVTSALSVGRMLLPRVGLGRLRGFLERRVDECYRRNVAKIVPVLQAEYTAAKRRLEVCERELDSLSVERLKAGADAFCDEFCSALREAIQGSVVAPPNLFGETLQQENVAAGSFHEIQGCPMAVSERTWDRLVATEVGNRDHRLYGGSQYHRALREFNLATRCLRLPTITEDEIANAAGVGDTHDGVNFLRAACVISFEKARTSFDPLLDALRVRITRVMERLCPMIEYMLRQRQERALSAYGYGMVASSYFGNVEPGSEIGSVTDIAQNPQFRQLIQSIFDSFVQKCSDSTMARCRDDLIALTRFVTWDLHERSGGALRRSLPDQTDIVAVYQVAVQAAKKGKHKGESTTKDDTTKNAPVVAASSSALTPISDKEDRDYYNLLQLMEEAACSRDANRTNLVVGGLVQHIVAQWRESFGRSVTTKFNCYFLLPFVDEFNRYLRQELQKVYEGTGDNLCEAFDLTAARRALEQQKKEIINECAANQRLQEKFAMVSQLMRRQQEKTNPPSSGNDDVVRVKTIKSEIGDRGTVRRR